MHRSLLEATDNTFWFRMTFNVRQRDGRKITYLMKASMKLVCKAVGRSIFNAVDQIDNVHWALFM